MSGKKHGMSIRANFIVKDGKYENQVIPIYSNRNRDYEYRFYIEFNFIKRIPCVLDYSIRWRKDN